ncbi:MAG: HAD-IC family P-type ATPase [Pararhodobacter sp.]|nr:HAD-IC family P-type ATPase [Pararhodobacter sp.]
MNTSTDLSGPETPTGGDTHRAARHWAEPASAVLAALDSTPEGLSADEARIRQEKHGPNSLPSAPRAGPLRRFLRQFNNLLILVLIVAAVITALLQHWVDTAVILAVVVINAVIGFVQEGKAEAALESLRSMLAPRANVLRDGSREGVQAVDLVPGDIVLLKAGDKVPADLRLIETAGLSVEEAILTGESVPVRKGTDPVEGGAELGDRSSMVFSGTLVSEGTATGVVTATGADSEIGRIGGLMASVTVLTTPLIRQMGRFAKVLTGFIMVVAALLLAFTVLWRGLAFNEAFMIVVALFVAAIPEGLPAVLTVTLAIGVQAMAKRNAIVRRLPVIETLGAVSVICTDKTGTLTRNEMAVTTLVTAGDVLDVTGEGYAPKGKVQRDGADVTPDAVHTALARVAALCNNAHLREGENGWRVEGDPMEGALLALATKLGRAPDERPRALATIPFDARYRYMAVLHDTDAGRRVLLKGAPEAVLERCSHQMTGEGRLPLDRSWWEEQAEAVANNGQRVLALAEMPFDGDAIAHDDLSGGLTLLGFTGLIDPPRTEAVTAVADCLSAGIDVKMITGDHKGTARAIARQIGLRHTDTVLTGAEIEVMDDAALQEAALQTDVFARTSPEHKLRLVSALQAGGQVVAMTGDGVNDAPALKRAEAGIAMGLKGSEAAREASDFVLADDNFASIAEAVRQGRTVYINLKKVISFLLPVNGGESAALIIAVLFGLMLPVTPLQVLWVNMVSSVVLAMSLAFEPPERDVMNRPPRKPEVPILTRFILWRVGLVSVLFAIGIYGQFQLALAQGQSVEVARTMAVNTLVAMEVFYLFSIRFRLRSVLTLEGVRGTPAVLVAVGIVVALQAAFTWAPPMQALFDTRALGLAELAQCTAAGVLVLLVLEFDKMIERGRKARQT